MEPTRRGFVRGVALAVGLSAGCVGVGGGVADIYVSNETDESVAGSVTARRESDGAVVLEKRFELAPEGRSGDNCEYEEVTDDGTVRVRVAVDSGPTGTHEFTDTSADAKGLAAWVAADRIEFSVGIE